MFLSISFVFLIQTFHLNSYLTNSLNDDGVEIAQVNEYGDEVPEHLTDRTKRDTDSVLKEYIKNLKNVNVQ